MSKRKDKELGAFNKDDTTDHWPEIIVTPSPKVAEEFASARLGDGTYRYGKPQYDSDRHEFIIIKARPRKRMH